MKEFANIDLREIFKFQDACANAHMGESELLRTSFAFVSDAFRLNARILQSAQFELNKQHAIRKLGVDTLSHIAVAVRLALWGALPESVAVWRGALESAAQLKLVVKDQSYRTFNYELSTKLKRLSYESAFEELGDLGQSLESLHGKLSERGSHSTAKRLALSDYELDGQEYDRLGFAKNPIYPLYVVHHSMILIAMVSDALFVAHEQEGRDYEWTGELSALLTRFDKLCEKYETEVPSLKKATNSTTARVKQNGI